MVPSQVAMTSVTCPWCRQFYPTHPGHACNHCGDPLPTPPGMALGAPPPGAPRTLPTEYRNKILHQNPATGLGTLFAGLGCVFLVVGVVFLIVFLPVGIGLLLFGALWGGVGWSIRSSAQRGPRHQLDALEHGLAAQGQIVALGSDTSESRNGRYPFRMDYVFQVNGQTASGSAKGYDPINGLRQPGQQVWVVHLARDPSISSLWPPIC